jgi:phosphoribosyl-ATP pyrophosphohydrolase
MTAILAKNATFDRQRQQPHEIERLYAALHAVTPERHPRTARLLGSSSRKVAQKVIEEAGEVALAAVKHNGRNIVRESADLLYQLAVLWHREGILPEAVWAEMRRRAETMGIAEKLPKAPKAALRSAAKPQSERPKAGAPALDRNFSRAS